MRILIAVNEARATGAPLSVLETLRAIDLPPDDVHVVLKRDGPLVRAFASEAQVIVQPGGWTYPALASARFHGVPIGFRLDKGVAARVLDEVAPQIVYADTVVTAEFAAAAADRGLPTLLQVRESEQALSRFRKICEGVIRDPRVTVLGNSEATAHLLGSRYGIADVPVIYPFVETAPFDQAAQDAPADRQVVLAVGTVGRRKGTDLYADVARAVRLKRPDVSFVWLGGHRSGLDRQFPGVEFISARSDGIAGILAAASVLVVPSREEPFGRVILEALAAGTPAVAFDVGGVAEAAGGGAMLVAPTSTAGLTDGVLQLLGSTAERNRLVAVGRQHMEERFGRSAFHKRLRDVLAPYGIPIKAVST